MLLAAAQWGHRENSLWGPSAPEWPSGLPAAENVGQSCPLGLQGRRLREVGGKETTEALAAAMRGDEDPEARGQPLALGTCDSGKLARATAAAAACIY